MTLLSIVVPFYGVEDYIEACLESLRAQTLTDFEVVMVDDGSPDGSRAIAERFVAMDDRFVLFTQVNQGIGPARNTGIAQSTGKYLTFVDSDDVVAPRAYSLMVDTLERTGSDFAGGNARRFNETEGTRQSWTHAQAFDDTRLGTNITEFPVLIRDRMVWNKVYRRSFWDAGGYSFPAMRYEDFPIALKAHLDAKAVDVLSSHVYYWRDRESGDSITQQVFNPGNARDRVRSAHIILDMLTPEVSNEITERLHAYFIDVDLVAMAGALATAPAEAQPELEELSLGLAKRLHLDPRHPVGRLAKLVYRGMRSGDLDFVRALSRWREGGSTQALVKEVVAVGHAHQVAPVLSAVVRRKKVPNPAAPRPLKSELVSARVDGRDVHLTISVLLRQQFATRVSGRVDLVSENRRRRLDVTYQVVEDGLTLDVVVPGAAVAELGDEASTTEISLELGPLRWKGQVKLPLEVVPEAWEAAPGAWVQPGRLVDSWFLWFIPLGQPVLITGIESTETGFSLTLSESTGEVIVPQEYPQRDIVMALDDGRVDIDVRSLQESDLPDNPITRVVERPITYRPRDWRAGTHYLQTFETDDLDRPAVASPVLPGTLWETLTLPYLGVAPVTVELGGEIVEIRGDGRGWAQVIRMPPEDHLSEADEPMASSDE